MRSRSITMKPNHILLITMLATASTAWSQQNQFPRIGTRQGTVSIYEYGDSLNSCETNFENLFRNWTKENITNADEYNLIGYSFVETIADTITINQYADLLFGNDALMSSVRSGSSSGSHVKATSYLYFNMNTFFSFCDTTNKDVDVKLKMLKDFNQERDNMKTFFKMIVNRGDKVYAVFFRDKKRTYTNFVICNEKTNKVVCDNLFKNIALWKEL
jgi:hypothetical protein